MSLDVSAGGFPHRTYVGRETTVADVQAHIAALEARCATLTARLRELAIDGHQGGWGDHIKHDFATCPEPSCVADRALIGEGT